MATTRTGQNFSGAAKVWEDFATGFHAISDEIGLVDEDGISSDEIRDEYVRLPYDEAPSATECHW